MNAAKEKLRGAVILLSTIGTIAMPAAELYPAWGPTEKELKMGVSSVIGATTMPSSEILVFLENLSKSDIVLNLGIMLANGKAQHPTAMQLQGTDSEGSVHKLQYFQPAGTAGRVDPFVVPLPAGATYQLRCRLDQFVQMDSSKRPVSLKPGQYKIAVVFEARSVTKQDINMDMTGLALMTYWTGVVRSGEVSISIP